MKKNRKCVAAIGFLIVGLVLLPWTSEAINVYARIRQLFPFTIFDFGGTKLLAIYILLLLSPFMLAGALLLDCRERREKYV